MPNRCENEIRISWCSGEIAKIKSYLKKRFFFSSFYPMPKALESKSTAHRDDETDVQYGLRMAKLKKKYLTSDRYDRRVNNRWTKRDVYTKDINIIHSWNDEIQMYMDTAWWPPIEAIAKLAKKHDKLRIYMEYSEWGMWFSWQIERKDWEQMYHEEYSDPYRGNTKQCTECKCWYDDSNDDDRWDEEHTMCRRCRDHIQAKTNP